MPTAIPISPKTTRVISTLSSKGSQTKTTTTLYLGKNFADEGEDVLLVDLDNNNTLSFASLIQATKDPDPGKQNSMRQKMKTAISKNSVRDLITYEQTDPSKVIFRSPLGFDVMPNAMDISDMSVLMSGDGAAFERFRRIIRSLGYTYVFIDCSPGIGEYLFNLTAHSSDMVLGVFSLFLWDQIGFEPLRKRDRAYSAKKPT